jgi:HEAT repeat protein
MRIVWFSIGWAVLCVGCAPPEQHFKQRTSDEMLQDAHWGERRRAVWILGERGPEAKDAVPQLVKLLGHNHLRRDASVALVKIGAAAVPALTEALQDQNVLVRSEAARILGQIGPEAKQSVPALADMVAKPGEGSIPVQEAAWGALMQIGPAAEPDLAKRLGDEDPEVRRVSLSLIGAVGAVSRSLSKETLPALQKALNSDDGACRAAAARALAHIGRQGMPILERRLAADDSRVRQDVVDALNCAGPAALPLLEKGLQDRDAKVRERSALSIGQIGPEATGAIPALLRAHGDDAARTSAVLRAIEELLPRKGAAFAPDVAELVKLLDHADPTIRQPAAEVLGEIGIPAEGALPQLEKRLQDQEQGVRDAAAQAISRIHHAVKMGRDKS